MYAIKFIDGAWLGSDNNITFDFNEAKTDNRKDELELDAAEFNMLEEQCHVVKITE